jgi:hypothetical protein
MFFLVMVSYKAVLLRDPETLADLKPFFGEQIHNWSSVAVDDLLIIFMLFSMYLYEYGQCCDGAVSIIPKLESIHDYFRHVWNWFDSSGTHVITIIIMVGFTLMNLINMNQVYHLY